MFGAEKAFRCFVTATEQFPDRAAAGDYVLNSTGGALTVTAGGAAGLVLNPTDALLWLGDTRLGTNGWAVVQGPSYEFAHTGAAAVGTTPGNWRYLNTLNWLKALAADPDQPTDVKNGDTQFTLEAQAKELKVWNEGAWHKVYSEVDVRAWIAALSLFEGTVQEVGGTVPNVLELSNLPNLALNTQIDKIAHYWTWQGSPGYAIKAADPNGVGRDLPGTILNPGDWLQVSNRSGDATSPDLRWTHVGGDLLAKSRGDNLYGLKSWTAGGWEVGSLVVHDQTIWRATGPVTAADIAPGATPVPPQTASPWQKVTLASGVRWVSTDTDLPASAPTGEMYFVLQSAQAGGSGALFYYDAANTAWQPLGGAGGQPMDLSSGYPIVNVGLPIGSVTMWLGANPPPGWLLLHGQTFSAGAYPELAQVLGSTQLPDMRGAFAKGAGAGANGWGDAARQPGSTEDYKTALPRSPFQIGGGDHVHNYRSGWNNRNGIKSSTWYAGEMGYIPHFNTTEGTGAHTHTMSGGDNETQPRNVAFNYIIKCADIAQRVRI